VDAVILNIILHTSHIFFPLFECSSTNFASLIETNGLADWTSKKYVKSILF